MSERLRSLTMRAFRGVPNELAVDLGNGRSLAVFGENGTGKSTIADALEWYFTGKIELLAHEGRQEAIRNVTNPTEDETRVEVQTTGGLGGVVTYGNQDPSLAVDAARKETFLLRGRTLADFINKSKSEKWKALAEILGFEEVEGLRQDLYKARGALGKRARDAKSEREAAAEALGLENVTTETVYAQLLETCRAASVDPPTSLQQAFDDEWTASVLGPSTLDTSKYAVAQLVGELERVPVLGPTFPEAEQWNEFLGAELSDDLAKLRMFQETARVLAKFDSDECPVCGQAVDHSNLVDRVKSTVLGLREAAETFDRCQLDLQSLIESLERIGREFDALRSRAEEAGIVLPGIPAVPGDLRASLQSRSSVDVESLREYGEQLAVLRATAKDTLGAETSSSGPPNGATRLDLIQFCGNARTWVEASGQEQKAAKAQALADRVYKLYENRQQDHLAKLLEKISASVAGIYEKLHPGEGLSSVTVEPWTAKGLELAIDFYGSHQRPPHGVLSESHLNSLAIAFFLAMAETFNETIRFLVLDDVVNSFDLEHRGALASLLASDYEDWQLLVLTHDHLFFEQLVRRAPSWAKMEFTSWNHEEGPRTTKYETGGMLAKAFESLKSGDRTAAATKGRRALEELLQEVCHGIGAALPFRRGAANDRREIGELISGLRHTLKDNAKGMYNELKPLLTNLDADVAASLNIEAHASMGKAANAEVEAALGRIQALDSHWTCPDGKCGTRIFHVGDHKSAMCKCTKSRYPPMPGNGSEE